MFRYVDVRGTRLAVAECAAPAETAPFLWAHCLLGSMEQDARAALLGWRKLETALRLFRFDVRGHGASSPCHAEQAFHFPELAQDVLALADQLGLAHFAMGGVSLGSALSLHVALAQPERVNALVLMGPPTAWDGRRRQALLYRRVASALQMGGMLPLRLAGAMGRIGERWFGEDRDGSIASVLTRSTVQQLGHMDRGSAVAVLRGAAASNLPEPELLSSLLQPTLILAWHNDPSHPAQTAERLAEIIPNSELHFAETLGEAARWTPLVEDFLLRNG